VRLAGLVGNGTGRHSIRNRVAFILHQVFPYDHAIWYGLEDETFFVVEFDSLSSDLEEILYGHLRGLY